MRIYKDAETYALDLVAAYNWAARSTGTAGAREAYTQLESLITDARIRPQGDAEAVIQATEEFERHRGAFARLALSALMAQAFGKEA